VLGFFIAEKDSETLAEPKRPGNAIAEDTESRRDGATRAAATTSFQRGHIPCFSSARQDLFLPEELQTHTAATLTKADRRYMPEAI
jgi:hypothetical protein